MQTNKKEYQNVSNSRVIQFCGIPLRKVSNTVHFPFLKDLNARFIFRCSLLHLCLNVVLVKQFAEFLFVRILQMNICNELKIIVKCSR